jgi:hypothetical protein
MKILPRGPGYTPRSNERSLHRFNIDARRVNSYIDRKLPSMREHGLKFYLHSKRITKEENPRFEARR